MATPEPSLPDTHLHTLIYTDRVKMVASSAYSMASVMDRSISVLLPERAAFAYVRKTRISDDG